MHPRSRSPLRAAALSACLTTPLPAANTPHYYVGPNNSNFSDPANWSSSPTGPGNSPPATNDLAIVSPSSPLTINLDSSPNNVTLSTTSLSGPLTVNASPASFSTANLSVSPGVTVNLTSGTIGFTQLIGTFSLSSSFTQSGGTVGNPQVRGALNASPYRFTLAPDAGSAAAYSLSAGAVYAQDEFLAESGSASFTQTGGTHRVNSSITLARNPGSSATYTLSGGSLSTAQLTLAESGGVTLFASAGAIDTQSLSVASAPQSSATLNLTGANFSVFPIAPLSGTTYLGNAGTATVHHSAGVFDTSRNASTVLGAAAPSSYTLSATATLLAHKLVIGASSVFSQTGGAVNLDDAFSLADSSIYDLLDGSLSAASVSNAGSFYSQTPATFTLTGTTFSNAGSATFGGSQHWPANSTFSNTLVAFFHTDPGSAASPTLHVTSASPDYAPVVFDAPQTHLASLSLSSSTHASLPPTATPSILYSRSLSITDAAQLDLTINTLLLDAPAVDFDPRYQEALLRQLLADGHLLSSSADALHTLAIIDVGSLSPDNPRSTTARSAGADDSTMLVTLALYGDANLDGVVNADDYVLIDRNAPRLYLAPRWSEGDFNHNGTIDQNDYLLIDRSFAATHPLSPDFLATRASQFGSDYVSQLLTSLPEPSLTACLFAGLLFHTRRRRRERVPSPVPRPRPAIGSADHDLDAISEAPHSNPDFSPPRATPPF